MVPPVESLVDAVQRYWTNFAYRGDPNGDGLTMWPRYDLAGDRHMTLVLEGMNKVERAQTRCAARARANDACTALRASAFAVHSVR